jgi:hypothetical protein
MKRPYLLLLFVLSACSEPKTYYNGAIDDIDCDLIRGWAMDWSRGPQSIDVTILDDRTNFKKRIKAALPRGDFKPGEDRHGFTIPTPAPLLDGKSHMVRMVFEDSDTELRNSPRPLNCTPTPVARP